MEQSKQGARTAQSSIILGIDPGLQGAVAALTLDGRSLWAVPMPTERPPRSKKRQIDSRTLAQWLRTAGGRYGPISLVALERVWAAPAKGRAQGSAGMFGFGRSCGLVEGILAGLLLRVELVVPQKWKAAVLGPRNKDGSNWSKAAAVAFAAKRFPSVDLMPGRLRVEHHGIAESLLIAEFGRRLLAGEDAA